LPTDDDDAAADAVEDDVDEGDDAGGVPTESDAAALDDMVNN
jgi:hypothetical protein